MAFAGMLLDKHLGKIECFVIEWLLEHGGDSVGLATSPPASAHIAVSRGSSKREEDETSWSRQEPVETLGRAH